MNDFNTANDVISSLIFCGVIIMKMRDRGNTFIWCIWWTGYLPPQLREVIADQFYFYLVLNCLRFEHITIDGIIIYFPSVHHVLTYQERNNTINSKNESLFFYKLFLLFQTHDFVGNDKVGRLLKKH